MALFVVSSNSVPEQRKYCSLAETAEQIIWFAKAAEFKIESIIENIKVKQNKKL